MGSIHRSQTWWSLTAPPCGRTHYGVYKTANEGTARVYSMTEGIGSIGLRPFVVYGPGRDQGLTSDPTTAMLAAAGKVSFRIKFGGSVMLTYAPDCARAFILAAQATSHKPPPAQATQSPSMCREDRSASPRSLT